MDLTPLLAEIDPKIMVVIYGAMGLAAFVFGILVLNFGMIWVRAWTSGAKVTFTELIALKLRSVPVGTIVDTRIMAVKSGIPLTIDDLSNYYLAGGNIEDVARALAASECTPVTAETLARWPVARVLRGERVEVMDVR